MAEDNPLKITVFPGMQESEVTPPSPPGGDTVTAPDIQDFKTPQDPGYTHPELRPDVYRTPYREPEVPGYWSDRDESMSQIGAEGRVKEAAITGAGQVFAAPLAKVGSDIAGVIAGAPRASASVIGLGALGGSVSSTSEAGERNPRSDEWWRSKRDPEPEYPKFEQRTYQQPPISEEDKKLFPEPPPFKEPKARPGDTPGQTNRRIKQERDAYDKRLKEYNARKDAHFERKFGDARRDFEGLVAVEKAAHETRILALKESYRAEQARLNREDDNFREQNRPFVDEHPYITQALPLAFGLLGGGMMYMTRVAQQEVRRNLVAQMEKTLLRAEKAIGKEGTAELRKGSAKGIEQALKDTKLLHKDLSLKETLARMAIAGLWGIEGAWIPFEYDLLTKPQGGYAYNQATDPGNVAFRGGIGAAVGASMALGGAKMALPGKPPVAPMQDLVDKKEVLRAMKILDKSAPARARGKKLPPVEGGSGSYKGGETIAQAAVKFGDGQVVTGANHAEVMQKAAKQGINFESKEAMKGIHMEDGFMTSTGRFVDRKEAADIALKSEQIARQASSQTGLLAEKVTYKGGLEPPQALEDALTKLAQGKIKPLEVKRIFKEHGWTVDLRRGRYDYEVFDPSGKAHYIQP